MFTIEQINDVHEHLGRAQTLFAYLKALKAIGVQRYDTYVTDGHSEYYGADGYRVVSSPMHDTFPIAKESNKNQFLEHLKLHEQGKTDYFQMSRALADSGIEKWRFDTSRMSITYYNKKEEQLFGEKITEAIGTHDKSYSRRETPNS